MIQQNILLQLTVEQKAKMPQGLCMICCGQFHRMYKFINQIKECNHKLMVMITDNQLDCLQEDVIDIPREDAVVNIEQCRDTINTNRNKCDKDEITTTDRPNISKDYVRTTPGVAILSNSKTTVVRLQHAEHTEVLDLKQYKRSTYKDNVEAEVNNSQAELSFHDLNYDKMYVLYCSVLLCKYNFFLSS